MSPLDATTTLLAPLKMPSALPGMPWWPSVISIWPSELNLTTSWGWEIYRDGVPLPVPLRGG
jgi:hypothetical protein